MNSPYFSIRSMVCSILVTMAAGLCGPLAHAAEEGANAFRGRIELPELWRMQAAVDPETPPKDAPAAWGRGRVLSGPGRMSPAQGVSWDDFRKANGISKDSPAHSAWLEREVDIPASWAGRRIAIDFPWIEGDAIVFMNGRRVAEILDPMGEVDLTEQARPGQKNLLRIFVTRDYTGISRGFEDDVLHRVARDGVPPSKGDMLGGGLSEGVTLRSRPKALAVSDVFVMPSWREKRLTLRLELTGDRPRKNVVAAVRALDAEGRPALRFERTIEEVPAGVSAHEVSAPWADPTPWELDGGYLYTLEMELRHDGKPVDAILPMPFGFREIWIEDRRAMMNGHPLRLRFSMTTGGARIPALAFYRLRGINAFPYGFFTHRWFNRYGAPYLEPEVLDYIDRKGIGALTGAPFMRRLRVALVEDERARKAYDNLVRLWMRRYRNRPAILAWNCGFNTFNPRDGIHPSTLGTRQDYASIKARVLETAFDSLRRHDPTRPVYSHADGNIGDIATSNTYPNYPIPLQERRDWPMRWAESGDMPWMAVEFGQPINADWSKNGVLCLTEGLAVRFGEEAYLREREANLREVVETTVRMNYWGDWLKDSINRGEVWHPLFWEFHEDMIHETDRAFRTWGVLGWNYWDFDIGWGNPSGWDPFERSVFSRNTCIRTIHTEPPDWANRNFYIHRETMRPLLVYLAGYPRHTMQDHAFYGGETVTKQVAVVWDGPGRTTVEAAWSVGRGAGRPVASGSATIAADVGDVRLVPFSFAAPRVDERTEYTIKLVATAGGETVADESFAIQVFPKEGPIETDRKIVVWDPKGLSTPWLRSLGLAVTPFENKASLKGADLLIVGREALASGGRLPFEVSDVMAGLRAIVLEQRPEMWDALGFEASEPAPRIVFRRDRTSPVFRGIEREDLSHWRGTPDLLPEFRQARQHDVPRRPKASNAHTVASVVLKNPHVAGFAPLAHCEWDLDYSPLIEMRIGRGAVWYSTFDITGRVGVDPAATRLARNLVETALEYERRPRRRFVYAGDEAYASRLAKLGIDLDPAGKLDDPAATVLVLGPGETGLSQEAIETFAKDGGRVVGVTCDVNRLRAMGYKLKKREVIRAFPVPRDEPMLRAVGANLLRWRDTLTTHRFDAGGQPEGCRVLGGGVFLSRSLGEGSILFVQVEPSMLADRYADEARNAAQGKAWRRHSQAPEPVKRRRAIVTSVVRLRQLLAQVLTNAGGAPSRALAERVCTLDAGPAFEALATWHVLGPYPVDAKLKPQEALGKAFDGEKNSIAGDTNPNIRYENSEGETLDYRTIARARPDGFVELDRAAGSRGVMTVAYATRIVRSDAARTAQLRIGADYWMRVWVNGKEVYRSGRPGPSHAHTPKSENEGGPLSPHRRVNIELKKGENVITFKVAAGSKGFGFFAFLSRPGADVTDPKDTERAPSLYRRRPQVPDPYTYHYY